MTIFQTSAFNDAWLLAGLSRGIFSILSEKDFYANGASIEGNLTWSLLNEGLLMRVMYNLGASGSLCFFLRIILFFFFKQHTSKE